MPTIFSTPLANPATKVLNATFTTPVGALWMGNHVWVSSATGFCRVDPGTAALTLTNCAQLPAGFTAGSAVFDKVNNWVYIPDTAGVNGIVRLLFNPLGDSGNGTVGGLVAKYALTAPLGTTSISVTTTGGGSNALPFTILTPPPRLTSIVPAIGVQGTNVAVTLTGTFLSGATINFPDGSGISLSGTPSITPFVAGPNSTESM